MTPFFVAREVILLCSRCRNIQCCRYSRYQKQDRRYHHSYSHTRRWHLVLNCIKATFVIKRFSFFSCLWHAVRWPSWFLCSTPRYDTRVTGYELTAWVLFFAGTKSILSAISHTTFVGPTNSKQKLFPRLKLTVT
jgi:hypothetical protein